MPKSIVKRYIFAPMGALTLLGVVILTWLFRFQEQVAIPTKMAEKIATASSDIEEQIGKPIRRGRFVTGHSSSDGENGTVDVSILLIGTIGSGQLSEWAQEHDGHWEICSLIFRQQNAAEPTVLVDDTQTHCERE